MKYKFLSRLTALLLAVMLMMPAVASASTAVEGTYEDLIAAMSNGECGTDNEYCVLLDTLRTMDASVRYGYLLDLHLNSDEGASLVAGAQLHHYYSHYENGTDLELLCTCNITSEEDIFGGYDLAMFPYGDQNHLADCPWTGTEDFKNGQKNAETFVALDTDEARTAFVAEGTLAETDLYDMLDVLGWWADTTLTTDDVKVVGAMPKGTVLETTELGSDKLNTTIRDFVLAQGGADMSILQNEYYEFTMAGHNVTLKFYGREIEPKDTLAITYFNVRDPYTAVEHVDAYVIHVLESAASIAKENDAGRTVYSTDNETLVTAYAGTAATQIEGYEGKVVYTLESDVTTNDVVNNADGSVTFHVDSLSGSSAYAVGDNADTVENFIDKSTGSYFYYRLENETTHADSNDCSHIATVKYSNTATNASNVDVPHYGYSDTKEDPLSCAEVVGYSGGKFADGSTNSSGSYPETAGAFTIYVETEPGWVVTSYRIGCEGTQQKGENCQTVEAQNLTVVPDENGNYISKITIPCSAKSFGHSSGFAYYVLLLTVQKVSINIGVTKSVSPQYVTYTKDDDSSNNPWLEYTVTVTNNSTNNINYTNVQFEDTFFPQGAILTSVSASGGDSLALEALLEAKINSQGQQISVIAPVELTLGEKIPTSASDVEVTYTTTNWEGEEETKTTTVDISNASNVIISVREANGAAFWAPGETITLKYKYQLTDDDAANGVLPNTVFVTALYDPDGKITVEDFNTAYVEVLISDAGFGSMQVYKTFDGLSKAQIDQLIGGDFAIVVEPEDTTVANPTIGTITKVSDTEYYWNVTGLVVDKTYKVSEINYTHPDFAVPASTVKVDYRAKDATEVTTLQTATTGTSYTTPVIVGGDTYFVYFTNTYTSGDLSITKNAVTHDVATLPTETLAAMEFPFIVTFTKADGTSASTAAYDYTITSGTGDTATEVSTGKVSSGGVIWLASGQTATIKGLPLGAAYSVVEANVIEATDGVTASTTGMTSGEMSYYVPATDSAAAVTYEFTVSSTGASGNIETDTTPTAVFTNTYGQSTSTLTITKAGSVTETDNFVFTVKGTEDATADIDTTVVITGTGSVTLSNLPLGSYTVTEDLDWAWRYKLSSVEGGTPEYLSDGTLSGSATVTVDADGKTITFTNTVENEQWLSDESSIVNFAGTNQ